MFIDVVGSIAFVTTVIGLFPQIYKAVKTRSTKDISQLMLINFTVCSLAWIIYGAYSNTIYVQMSNVIALISCLILITLKWIYDRS